METTHFDDAPQFEPPMRQGGVADIAGAPTELPETVLQRSALVPGAAPTVAPPTETQLRAAEEAGVAAWYTNKKVVALWCNASNRNAYISVPGLGWKKLANANDSCVVSLTMLASHAEQTNTNVNLRLEADGMVHQLYVW